MNDLKIAVIGMGYVGLPLAIELGNQFFTVGFDVNIDRIAQLKKGFDKNKEFKKKKILSIKNLNFSRNEIILKNCNFYIVAVPTPINKKKEPDLDIIINATRLVAKYLKKGDIVVYESTVYPGFTREEMVPIIEKNSKLKLNKDFYCGYSPERINPGDKKNTITNITKITSSSNNYSGKIIKHVYSSIISSGIHHAPSIEVAEAAKIIENTQRDLNIALVNELKIFFDKLNLNTFEILKAASTKWNFLNFQPGLVGGHCIGVDPYYLTYKAKKIGYETKVVLAGRKINDDMPKYYVKKFVKIIKSKFKNKIKNILFLGISFKENCPDTRNSKAIEMALELIKKGFNVKIYDPICDDDHALKKHQININKIKNNSMDALIIPVKHEYYINYGLRKILKKIKKQSIVYDIKNIFENNEKILSNNHIYLQ